MYVIAVNISQDLIYVRRLYHIFRRRRKGFDFDDESMFFVDDVVEQYSAAEVSASVSVL